MPVGTEVDHETRDLNDGTRDGELIVVSRDLDARRVGEAACRDVAACARDLGDERGRCCANWRTRSRPVPARRLRRSTREARRAAAARAQWLDASAFHSHGDLMEKVFGLEPPPDKHRSR